MGLPWRHTTAPFPLAAGLDNATATFVFKGFMVDGMGWVHELAHAAGVHTCHTPDCRNLVPVLLTWHSTLYN
jgi:hypothetical protein